MTQLDNLQKLLFMLGGGVDFGFASCWSLIRTFLLIIYFAYFCLQCCQRKKGNLKVPSPYIVQGVRCENDTHPGEVKHRVLCIVSMS